MRDRKKRNIIIGSLCCLLVFMAVGYALLKQVLNINGTASITGGWKIRISDISVHEVIGTATNIEEKLTYTDSEATFGVNLVKPGDKIIYKVTVVNEGSIDAVLSIDSTTTSHKDIKFMNTLASGEILYGSGSANGTTKLSEKEFYVTAEFSESATDVISGEISEYKIQLTYTQYDGNSLYEPPKDVETDNGVFQVSADGTILKYNADLGTSVSIPAEVDGIPITSIASDAFRDVNVTYNYDIKAVADEGANFPSYGVLLKPEKEEEARELFKESGLEELPYYVIGDPEIPSLSEGQSVGYYNLDTGFQVPAILPEDEGFLGEYDIKTKLLIKSLDLSNATNLKRIEHFAFSNANEQTTDLSTLEIGLTNLTLGNNMNAIELGMGVFSGADIDYLELYTSFKGGVKIDDIYGKLGVSMASEFAAMEPFSGANIDKLIIKATPEYSSTQSVIVEGKGDNVSGLYYGLYQKITVEDLYIEEGVTEISYKSFGFSKISNLRLPNSLIAIGDYAFIYNYLNNSGAVLTNVTLPSKLKTIGMYAFYNQNITGTLTVPSGVVSIGDHAFKGNSNLTNILQQKNGTTCNRLGTNWYENNVTYTCE